MYYTQLGIIYMPGTQLPSIHKTFIYGNHILPLSILVLLAHSAGCILIL